MLRTQCRGIFQVVGTGLVHHVGNLRLGVQVAHGHDLVDQRIHDGQLRIGRVELLHHGIDYVRRLAQKADAFAGQRHIGGAQALEQAFQRRQHLHQQGDVDHGDGPVQGMHGAQQFFPHPQFGARAVDGAAYRLQILGHFAAQDLQQNRVHRRHHRQRQRFNRFDVIVRRACQRVGVGDAGLRNRCRIRVHARHAAAYDPANRFGNNRRMALDPRALLASGQSFGHVHDGAERCLQRAFALERGQQLRQRIDGPAHHRLHAFMRFDAVVEHAIERAFDLPCKLAEHAGANQPARTFQCVERAADGRQ